MVLAVLQALSYLGGLPGGWVADNRLGARMATMLGALLLAPVMAHWRSIARRCSGLHSA